MGEDTSALQNAQILKFVKDIRHTLQVKIVNGASDDTGDNESVQQAERSFKDLWALFEHVLTDVNR
jgi:hypothetical protein